MLRRLYHKTLALTQRKSAEYWLAGLAFIESFFFPVPADVMFIPMALANPSRAFRLAASATFFSCLGGAFGYGLGMFGYEKFALPLLEAMGKADSVDRYRELLASDLWALWGLLLSSGLTHIPPIKIVTILSGLSGVNFAVFMISAVIGRGFRFFLLAWLLKKYGEPIKEFIEKRLPLVSAIFAVLVIAVIVAVKMTH